MRVKHKDKRITVRDGGRFAKKPTLGLRICPCGAPIIPEYHTKRLGFVVKEDRHKCKGCRDED